MVGGEHLGLKNTRFAARKHPDLGGERERRWNHSSSSLAFNPAEIGMVYLRYELMVKEGANARGEVQWLNYFSDRKTGRKHKK